MFNKKQSPTVQKYCESDYILFFGKVLIISCNVSFVCCLITFTPCLLLDLKGQIDSLAKEYTANARTLSSEQKLSILRQIQQSYSKCKEFGDDKVQLAMQTYEMVSILKISIVFYAHFLGNRI